MTRRTKLLAGACLLALAAVGLWLLLRERKPAREQIVESIMALADAAEAQDVAGCMRLISADYRDSRENTRDVLWRLARGAFRDAESIDVTVYEPEITISGSEATATLEAELSAVTSTGRHSEKLEVTFDFKREGRRWRIVEAEGWQQIEPAW